MYIYCIYLGEQIRQLEIVDVNHTLTEQDKDKLVNSDDPSAVSKFLEQKYVLSDATNEQLLSRLTSLEQQHDGLLKIERSVQELNQLFNELNILVIEQQDLIDNIEQNVVETKQLVESGTHHLEVAERHQKCTRKYMLIGCICCFIILMIIIISAVSGNND